MMKKIMGLEFSRGKIAKSVLGLAFAAALSVSAFAQSSVDALVPQKYLADLKAGGKIELVHEPGEDALVLLPKSAYAASVTAARIKKDSAKVDHVTEYLYLVKKSLLVEKSVSPKDAEVSIQNASKILRSVSKMKGMTYFSRTNKKRNVLYKDTYMYESPSNTKPIADKNTGSADGQVSYVYQDDHTFGDCYYRVKYQQSAGEIAVEFMNVEPLKYGPIKAVDPENMKINVIAIDCGDSFLVYMATDCSCSKLPGARKTLTDSFGSRIEAMYDWFVKQF